MKTAQFISGLGLVIGMVGSSMAYAQVNGDLETTRGAASAAAPVCQPTLARVLFQQGRSRITYSEDQFAAGYAQLVAAYRAAAQRPPTAQQVQQQISSIADAKLGHVFPGGSSSSDIIISIHCKFTRPLDCTITISW